MADKTLILPCYRDELGPAYSHGNGGGQTTRVALAGGLSAIYGMTFGPGAYVDTLFQLNHDAYIPGTGTVDLHPHVHWTCVAAPGAGTTCIWEFEYIFAKPTLVTTAKGAAVAYGSSSTVLTGPTFTFDGSETRMHFLTDLGDIQIPVANYSPSLCIWGTFRMKATSNVSPSIVALQFLDLHKLVTQVGTASEYV